MSDISRRWIYYSAINSVTPQLILNLGFESTYGTPPVSGYRRLPFVSSNIGAEQGLIERKPAVEELFARPTFEMAKV